MTSGSPGVAMKENIEQPEMEILFFKHFFLKNVFGLVSVFVIWPSALRYILELSPQGKGWYDRDRLFQTSADYVADEA